MGRYRYCSRRPPGCCTWPGPPAAAPGGRPATGGGLPDRRHSGQPVLAARAGPSATGPQGVARPLAYALRPWLPGTRAREGQLPALPWRRAAWGCPLWYRPVAGPAATGWRPGPAVPAWPVPQRAPQPRRHTTGRPPALPVVATPAAGCSSTGWRAPPPGTLAARATPVPGRWHRAWPGHPCWQHGLAPQPPAPGRGQAAGLALWPWLPGTRATGGPAARPSR